MSIQFSGFSQNELPFNVVNSVKMSHWISSCKVFLALKERYWEKSRIPQLISTDTFLQGVYGYALQTPCVRDAGVIMLSYTWEDDATKLLAEKDDEVLVSACLSELDVILARCGLGSSMSAFVDRSRPAVIHWSRHPESRGCAKLYRQRTWSQNQALLTYNQRFSSDANLYFAGEAFSVEGGWAEPAVRLGLDAALHVIHNTGGRFLHNFDFQRDYPKHDLCWTPSADEGS
jgi:monoamine oxidase